jgi:two-component system sensor histidine kinase DesK
MRERIACDLHDEIGANVSSMAHTAELLAESIGNPSPSQTRLLGNLTESARLTYRETKHFIRFIEGEHLSQDIAGLFTQTADQILGTIPRAFSLENTRSFNALDPMTKWNLLLFYKEALNNIIKHADASEVTITAYRQDKQLMLKVADNGCGFSQEHSSCRRLEARAALLRGKLEIDSHPGEGTGITLQFKNRRKP